MKAAKRPDVERAIERLDESVRLFLFHGPDEAGSAALAERVGARLGADADRIDADGAQLARDPAWLADEAAAQSLFGGPRWIRVRASGDEVLAAAEALLEAPRAGNPVVILAGALKPASKLLKLALASPHALAFASYVPEGGDAARLATGLAAARGLTLSGEGARALVEASGGNRAVLERELDKLADYLDADAQTPRTVSAEAIAAVIANDRDADPFDVIDPVLTGMARQVADQIRQGAVAGPEAVAVIRAAFRRVLQLAALRVEADDRQSISAALEAAGKSLFWKDKPVIEAALRRWDGPGLATIIDRLTDAHAQMMAPGSPAGLIAAEQLLTIARAAARRR
ncbi:DNA polymerase III subunit delta [Sphingomonas changnyeongensis]|uniref:DNA-directed DNA polymerase n=1 Tax=Sphingomonas changnyeongensis TaxID=2698679 RepID=A0A7Z2NUH1_9SPHN|nr:DNA polymerase III subunit delta [Sphingomonas changnyeongensis]QHL90035.1 DNA polymerase III subunit delta [Sphingomonas changnyeongensis]